MFYMLTFKSHSTLNLHFTDERTKLNDVLKVTM